MSTARTPKRLRRHLDKHSGINPIVLRNMDLAVENMRAGKRSAPLDIDRLRRDLASPIFRAGIKKAEQIATSHGWRLRNADLILPPPKPE